jgi:hypothetical protein
MGCILKKNHFWEVLASFGALARANTILGGDLNFTLFLCEVLGVHPHKDPLNGFFAHLIEVFHLRDLEPPKLVPTWQNGRKCVDGISKCLDRIIISKYLVEGPWTLKSWVGSGGISDHSLVFLKLECLERKPLVSMKFNNIWLAKEDYMKLVSYVWNHLYSEAGSSFMQQFHINL